MSTRHLRTVLAILTGAAMVATVSACAQGGSNTTTSSTTGAASAAGSSSSQAAPSPSSSSAPAASGAAAGKSTGKKVILIGDQAFGDHGPMDDMAAALQGCQSKEGFQTKKIVALTQSDYQSSINAAAKQGYNLIITTFPQMSDATVAAAQANPNIKFAAIYQFINDQGKKNLPNVWDSSFDINGASYAEGVLAATLSKTHKVGVIVGDLDPTIAGSLNAFIQGAKATAASTQVLWANANSFGDPAKGKDLAKGMIAKGADVLTTNAAQTQLGVLDAAKSAGILFFGDNGDNSSVYPKGFVSDLRSELGKAVTTACEDFATGKFEGGQHTTYNLANGGADVATSLITKWGAASGDSQRATQILDLYNSTVKKIESKSITVVNDPNAPKS